MPYQLMDHYESRKVLTNKVYFAKQAWSHEGDEDKEDYRPTYYPVLAVEVPKAEVGDKIDVWAQVTVMGRSFRDFRKPVDKKTKLRPIGACMCRAMLRCCTEVPPQDGKLWGEQLWLDSGENILDVRPYFQPCRRAVFDVVQTPVVLAYYIAVASAGGKYPQYVQVPDTSDYGLITALHHRRLSGSVLTMG